MEPIASTGAFQLRDRLLQSAENSYQKLHLFFDFIDMKLPASESSRRHVQIRYTGYPVNSIINIYCYIDMHLYISF